MGAVEVKKVQGEVDRSEAACVDEEYEYLLKNKDQGITFEEYCRRVSAPEARPPGGALRGAGPTAPPSTSASAG
ncbi:MAG: hypothetical protein XE07_0936 [Methanothrix harundinacea]|uniref:Uncharacterized protein n=1 Tax=Methanothrix harundinacea TaxID=301375 RepID=A0A124G3F0_9EURY|nr:MAG: hypothetical protein XE07_0936 [Methanothrix harundinacea]